MKLKKSGIFLALMMSAVTALTACGGGGSSSTASGADSAGTTASGAEVTPTAGGTIDLLPVTIASDPNTIDPALSTTLDAATMIKHMFEGLYRNAPDGSIELALASDVKVSDDQLTYTFTLRDGLKWSDGSEFTAEDFIFAWERSVTPETGADYAYLFEVIKGYDTENPDFANMEMSAPDAKTVSLTLKAPIPYIKDLLTMPVFLPVKKDVVEASPEQWTMDSANCISNGAYSMKEWIPGSHLLMEKNPNYWDAASVTGPNQIKFLFMEDENAMVAGYQNNELMMIDTLAVDQIADWKDKPDYNADDYLGLYYISYNTQREPMSNPLVRKALTLATDRQYLAENIGKVGQKPASGFVPLAITDVTPDKSFRTEGGDYYDPSSAAFAANLEEAKKALAEAGYPEGKGLPTLTYIFNTTATHQQMAEALQNMWKEIGVNVDIKSQEWSVFVETRKNGDYDIARNGWVGDYNDPINFLDMLTSTSQNNDGQWKNAEFDSLINEVRNTGDQAKRIELMHKAEDIVFAEWVLNPIYFETDIYLIKPDLKGFWSDPTGVKYFSRTSK